MDTTVTRSDLAAARDGSEPAAHAMMMAVHDALRRDLDRLVDAVGRPKYDDPNVRNGVRAGWELFRSQLHNHHTLEDTQIWPRLRVRLEPAGEDPAVLDYMEAEHEHVGALLAVMGAALDDPFRGPATRSADAARLASGLCDHLSHEEREVLPLLTQYLTAADLKETASAQRREQGLRGAALVLPWMMDGAHPSRARVVLDMMPLPARVLFRHIWQPRYVRRQLWGA